MSNVTMRQMLEAGVHFGHQTRYWNPEMAPYIFGARNKIHIINLEESLPMLTDSCNFLGKTASQGGTVLFVGTKRSAGETIKEEAIRCGMPYVNHRWLGGMMTNYKTIKQSINRLKNIDAIMESGDADKLVKKEVLMLTRERDKLEKSLGGIKNMKRLPDVVFVVDVGYEKIAIQEANKLRIPVVAVVDTNNSPQGVEYVIPGNDDAIRSIQLYVVSAADAILEGKASRALHVEQEQAAAAAEAREAEKASIKAKKAKADAKVESDEAKAPADKVNATTEKAEEAPVKTAEVVAEAPVEAVSETSSGE